MCRFSCCCIFSRSLLEEASPAPLKKTSNLPCEACARIRLLPYAPLRGQAVDSYRDHWSEQLSSATYFWITGPPAHHRPLDNATALPLAGPAEASKAPGTRRFPARMGSPRRALPQRGRDSRPLQPPGEQPGRQTYLATEGCCKVTLTCWGRSAQAKRTSKRARVQTRPKRSLEQP